MPSPLLTQAAIKSVFNHFANATPIGLDVSPEVMAIGEIWASMHMNGIACIDISTLPIRQQRLILSIYPPRPSSTRMAQTEKTHAFA